MSRRLYNAFVDYSMTCLLLLSQTLIAYARLTNLLTIDIDIFVLNITYRVQQVVFTRRAPTTQTSSVSSQRL